MPVDGINLTTQRCLYHFAEPVRLISHHDIGLLKTDSCRVIAA